MADQRDPLNEYVARRDRWQSEQQRSHRRFLQLGNWRLAVAVVAAVMAFFSIARQAFTAWWLLVPVVVFVALVVLHQRVIRRRKLAERGVRFYERGIARLKDAWIGTGNSGDQFRDPAHVYSEDLDVFGKGSLFELISTARTGSGRHTLANWFRSPASRDEALAR